MPAYSAFLQRVLRLQIRYGNLGRGRTFGARSFQAAGRCGSVFGFSALGRLKVPARDVENGGRRYDDFGADREHAPFVRAAPWRIGAIAVIGRDGSPSRPTYSRFSTDAPEVRPYQSAHRARFLLKRDSWISNAIFRLPAVMPNWAWRASRFRN